MRAKAGASAAGDGWRGIGLILERGQADSSSSADITIGSGVPGANLISFGYRIIRFPIRNRPHRAATGFRPPSCRGGRAAKGSLD
ncbi:hypothetical protein GCM10027256_03080 [Novispirillum itersonii subsp. nipponicum]